MSRDEAYLDDRQLQAILDTELARAVTGGGFRTDTGLDSETFHALGRVASAYTDVSPQVIAAAQVAFAGQLDGSRDVIYVPSFLCGQEE